MRLPRFRIRTLMIAVAAVAVVAASGVEIRRLRQLSSYYRKQAAVAKSAQMYRAGEVGLFEKRVKDSQAWADEAHGENGTDGLVRSRIAIRDQVARQVDHWSDLRSKYERAARYPWLSVEPDPPEPAVTGLGGSRRRSDGAERN